MTAHTKSLVRYEATATPGGWLVTATWKWTGDVTFYDAGGPRTVSRSHVEQAAPVFMNDEVFAAFKRIWT